MHLPVGARCVCGKVGVAHFWPSAPGNRLRSFAKNRVVGGEGLTSRLTD